MATAMLSARASPSFTAILPRLSAPRTYSTQFASAYLRPLSLPLLPRIALSIPAISLNLPSLPSWEEIWDGLLKAVPKKKASHSRRRHRQMAGKALKDITELCRCPSCGGVKRMHFLCQTCAPKYANMMADLMDAPKPKKTASLSKMSEIPVNPSRKQKTVDVPIDLSRSLSKGAQVTIDKKGGPKA
ncbi:unnamed protein product [Discula destructiva]